MPIWITDYFYINQTYTPVELPDLAVAFQMRLLNFVARKQMADWPDYGQAQQLFNITADGFETTTLLESLRVRCEAVNRALLDPSNGV